MIRIGDFSKLSRVSVKTLRYYDEVGLLKPVEVDRFTGYRTYSIGQLARLNRILVFKDLGFSLEQIAQLLDESLPAAQIRGMLRLKEAEIQDRVREEHERLALVEARLGQIEQEGSMPAYDVVIKKVEPQLVASLRGVIPTYADQGGLWDEMDAFLGRHKANPVGPCLSIYHDTEYKEHDVDVEVCEPLGQPISGNERVKVYTLPAVETMACVIHRGDFRSIGETYNALVAWIESNGYRIIGPNREVYVLAVGASQAGVEYPARYLTDKDENRVTEVQFPVAK